MNSSDYWLLEDVCPACQMCDHKHCDPDRSDCPSRLCECVDPLDIPSQRSSS